jgi:beta-barrel assembly-enhancing protease
MDGLFLDGWSLADVPVDVRLEAETLTIVDGAGLTLRCWTTAGLHIDAMQEGGTYHVTHDGAPHEELVLKNGTRAAELLALTKRVVALPGGRNKLAFGAACLAALVLIMGGLYWTTPMLARFVAKRIPLQHERALGAEFDLALSFDRCDHRDGEARLERLVAELVGHEAAHYRVRIVGMEMPNAFALPGGVVLVTKGLLDEAESGDEIAGVLAHEVEHVEQRHVLAGALRDMLLTAVWSITLGDYSGLMVVDPTTAYRIANLEFTREDEAAADRGAVTRLHRLGASHAGLVTFFERIEKLQGAYEGPAWLSTHPNSAERVRALKALRDVEHPRVLLDEADVAMLRAGCASE